MLEEGGRGAPCDGLAFHPGGVAIQSNLVNMDIQWLACLYCKSRDVSGGGVGGQGEVEVIHEVLYEQAPPRDPFPQPFFIPFLKKVPIDMFS